MAELGPSGPSNQASNSNRVPAHRGRGRGYGRGRGRGGNGATSNAPRNAVPTNTPTGPQGSVPQTNAEADPAPFNLQNAQDGGQRHVRHGRGGGGSNGNRSLRRGRGGLATGGQTTRVVSARGFGGHLTGSGNSNTQADESRPDTAGLRATAPNFVPGQAVVLDTSRQNNGNGRLDAPKPAKAGRSTAEDMPTRIHEDMDNGHYDCCICLDPVKRSSTIWSCPHCWTVTHSNCAKKWLRQKNNDREIDNGQAQAGRCPGCNLEVPESSLAKACFCWCGKKKSFSVAPPALPPHSCGRICGKKLPRCSHTCPVACHAGPCPPCTEMGPAVVCFCGKQVSTQPCILTDYEQSWSCKAVCGLKKPCGVHACDRICHPDDCGDCLVSLPSICYCGKTRKSLLCRQRGPLRKSANYGQLAPPDGEDKESSAAALPATFEGSFICDKACDRAFDCGFHKCKKSCHQQDGLATHCPLSPDVVTHCPCGKSPLLRILDAPRSSCQDAIPTCSLKCGKTLSCNHKCQKTCHTGECPPCEQVTTIACRCGSQQASFVCGSKEADNFECETECRTLLNCGQHKCRRVCCPGAPKASARRALSKSKQGPNPEYEPEHICLRPCGRRLACGHHNCQQLCHRSLQCLTCTEYVTEELRCPCGRTALLPPFPCGTTLPACRYNCSRELACGHAAIPHPCHDDTGSCPRCRTLVNRACQCGKITRKTACGSGPVSCDTVCDKMLKCGRHRCQKLCHAPGECEDAGIEGAHCSQPCGRPKAVCGHPCTMECHETGDCNEEELCQFRVTLTCECQRRKQEVRCLACTANPSPDRAVLKCDDECRRLQRNAAMKNALQIADNHEDNHVPYSAETMDLFAKMPEWALAQEIEVRAFAVDPDEKRLNFKPMAKPKRLFLHLLAEDYGLDSQSQDPEPHRHVSLYKTPRFVSAPAKTLNQCDAIRKKERGVRATLAAQAAIEAAAERERAKASLEAKKRNFNALLFSPPRAKQTGMEPDELCIILTDMATHDPALPIRSIRFASKRQSDGAVVFKAQAPATAPAVVERCLRSLLKNFNGPEEQNQNQEGEQAAATPPVLLCYVDANMNVRRREGDGTSEEEGGPAMAVEESSDAGLWNVVASRAATRHGPAASSASPGLLSSSSRFGSGASAAAGSAGSTGRKPARALFTLKKTRTPAAAAAAAAEERQRRMDILAQEPVEERQEEAGQGNDEKKYEKNETETEAGGIGAEAKSEEASKGKEKEETKDEGDEEVNVQDSGEHGKDLTEAGPGHVETDEAVEVNGPTSL